jgi:hypothetical protein
MLHLRILFLLHWKDVNLHSLCEINCTGATCDSSAYSTDWRFDDPDYIVDTQTGFFIGRLLEKGQQGAFHHWITPIQPLSEEAQGERTKVQHLLRQRRLAVGVKLGLVGAKGRAGIGQIGSSNRRVRSAGRMVGCIHG